MDYNHITGFLDRFKKLLFQKEETCKIIAKIISTHTHFPIEPELIKVKGSTIYLAGSPFLKSEILIHKSQILSDLKKEIPQFNFREIK